MSKVIMIKNDSSSSQTNRYDKFVIYTHGEIKRAKERTKKLKKERVRMRAVEQKYTSNPLDRICDGRVSNKQLHSINCSPYLRIKLLCGFCRRKIHFQQVGIIDSLWGKVRHDWVQWWNFNWLTSQRKKISACVAVLISRSMAWRTGTTVPKSEIII